MLEYITDFYQEIKQSENFKANLDYLIESTAHKINFSVIATLVELEPLVKICRFYLSTPSMFVQLISEQLMQFFQD